MAIDATGELVSASGHPESVVGREADIDRIDRFLQAMTAGFAALLIGGEPGIGKTTLWRVATKAAALRDYRLLTSRPTQAETSVSFAGLLDLLEPVPNHLLSELPDPQREALEGALLRTQLERPVRAGAVSIAVLGVIRALTRLGPVVLAVDDFQWLDRPTARVLEFIFRRLHSEPLGVVITYRHDSQDRFGLERAVEAGFTTRIDVGPLSLSALYQLFRDRLGVALARPVLVRVQETSGGNPFFALELARALLDGGQEFRGRPLPVPDSLTALLRERLRRLPARTRGLLLAAAALSNPRLDDLRQTVDLVTGGEVEEELERAEKAGIVQVEGGAIRFTHPLLASAAYDAATSAKQRQMHRRLTEIVEDPEERARHMALGASDADEGVASALDGAAVSAESRGATDVASHFAEQALALTAATDARRFRRAMVAATLARSAGDHARARGLLAQAIRASSPGLQRGEALLLQAELADPLRRGLDLCEQALREAGDNPSLTSRIHRTFGAIAYSLGDVTAAQRHASLSVRHAEKADDPKVLGMSLAEFSHWTFCGGGGVRKEMFERAITLDGSAGALSPRSHLAKVLMDAGELDEGRSRLEGLLADTMRDGDLQGAATHRLHLGELEVWAGNWSRAIEQADESLLLRQHTDQASAPLYVKAMSHACLGRIVEARKEAGAGLAEAERTEDIVYLMQNLHVLGFIELSLDNQSAAQLYLKKATELLRPRWNREFGDCHVVPDEIEAIIALGDLERAEDLIGWMEEVGAATKRAWTQATSARCRGLQRAAHGQIEEAVGALEDALSHHQRISMPFEQARTLLVKGTLERRLRQRAAARSTLENALAIFERLGASLWAEKAKAELSRIGVRSVAQRDLTPVEQRIAELVAAGHTNREIAELLFVSPKTVEANLSHIYRKLGIRSRTQLTAAIFSK
jgi:DNA-binding CsgD family transcriptional regulator